MFSFTAYAGLPFQFLLKLCSDIQECPLSYPQEQLLFTCLIFYYLQKESHAWCHKLCSIAKMWRVVREICLLFPHFAVYLPSFGHFLRSLCHQHSTMYLHTIPWKNSFQTTINVFPMNLWSARTIIQRISKSSWWVICCAGHGWDCYLPETLE